MSRGVAWKMTPSWVVICDPRKAYPKGHDIAAQGRQAVSQIQLMRHGGLNLVQASGGAIHEVSVRGRFWSCEFLTSSPVGTIVASGFVDEASGRLVVNECGLRPDGATQLYYHFDDWHQEPRLGWIARQIRYNVESVQSRAAFDGIEIEQPEFLAECAALPSISSPASLRPQADLRMITDHRTAPPVHTFRSPNGIIETIDHDHFAKLEWRAKFPLQLAGWLCTSAAVIFVIFLRLQQVRRPITPCVQRSFT